MALRDWFFRRTPLQLALERGRLPGAELDDELRKLGDYRVKSRADAEAICGALAQLAAQSPAADDESALHALVGLFQNVEGPECPAFPVLAEQGTPILVRIVDEALCDTARQNSDDILFALKILAMYATAGGTDAVLRAARKPLQPDGYMWSVILGAYASGHPERERLFEELSDPLPTGFLSVCLLDSANAAHRDGAEDPHPFDSSAGVQELERWLTDQDEDHFSYAVSATAALPFLTCPERDAMLALAFDHASADVQIEAAWVAAKLGREAGIDRLARCCLDVNLSTRAKQYLQELGRGDAIPAGSEDAGFQAKAEFAQWLAHPNELGHFPDELGILDHRQLEWPLEREAKSLWLLKYRVRDETGLKEDDIDVGLVGSVTFCLFSYKLAERPPEDAYAIHCYWEMANRGLITEADIPEHSTEYDAMLRQHAPADIADARIVSVAELSPDLKHPRRLVALAKGTRHGESGWFVLDGPGSRWYAASEMPADAPEGTVLMVHLGRALLGFGEEPDRRKYLKPPSPRRPPGQIISAYQRLLDRARSDASQAKKLLGRHSMLGSAFDDYVSALASVGQGSKAACTCAAYEEMLAAAAQVEPSLRSEVFDVFAPLGQAFDSYVEALVELNRQAEVSRLVEEFRPYWDHNMGYGKLGGAAFKSGHDQLAESLIVQLRHSMKDWCRSEEIDFLAEIWCKQERADEAYHLLIDALKGLLEQSRSATGSDCELFESWYQGRRSAFLRLFPDRGVEELERHRIPSSTLPQAS